MGENRTEKNRTEEDRTYKRTEITVPMTVAWLPQQVGAVKDSPEYRLAIRKNAKVNPGI